MQQRMLPQAVTDRLLAGKVVDFRHNGIDYLIEEENNKGWDYLSIWRIGGSAVCLERVFFDIFSGVTEETIRELCEKPCIGGRSLLEVLPEVEF